MSHTTLVDIILHLVSRLTPRRECVNLLRLLLEFVELSSKFDALQTSLDPALHTGSSLKGHCRFAGRQSVQQLLASFEREVDSKGLDVLAPHMHLGTYARPRVFEIAAALNRLRTIKVQQHR